MQKKKNIWWREDISNKESKFLRNSIRNDLVSQFYNKNSKTILFLRNDFILIHQSISNIFKIITINFVNKTFCWCINIRKLLKITPITYCIYRLFVPYGFCNILYIEKFLQLSSGKQIYSKRYRLLNDRNRLIISNKEKNEKEKYKLHFEINDFMDQNSFISIDFETISWPIFFDNLDRADLVFYKKLNHKKINKLLKEDKLNLFEKDEICIIFNADKKIIWIINFGLNMLFKITLKTNIILNIY